MTHTSLDMMNFRRKMFILTPPAKKSETSAFIPRHREYRKYSSSISHMFLLKYKFLILCSVEYSYITGLSLICPLKVSRALVSVCFLGQCSYVSQGGWCVPCPVYLTLVLLKLEWKWLYQLARRDSPGPFPITIQFIVTFTLIIL